MDKIVTIFTLRAKKNEVIYGLKRSKGLISIELYKMVKIRL